MAKIKVEKKLCDYIEGLHYEYGARQDVISTMLSGNMDIDSDAFRQYQKELVTFKTKYETAKSQLERDFIFPKFGGKKVKWTLDFGAAELSVEES